MPITVSCPCGKETRVKDELVGKRIRCPACGETMLVGSPRAEREAARLASRRGSREEGGNDPPRTKKRRRKPKTRSWILWLALGAGLAVTAATIIVVIIFRSGKVGPGGGHVATRIGATKGIEALAYSPDGRRLAIGVRQNRPGGFDRSIRIWDLAADEEMMKLGAHDDVISHLAFSPDSQLVSSGSGNRKEIKIWDLNARALRHQVRIAEGAPGLGELLLAFDLSGKFVISVCQGYVVRINVETGKDDREILSINRTAQAACSPIAPIVAIAQSKGPPVTNEMDIYDYQTSKVQTISISSNPTHLAFSRDGASLAMATAAGPIEVFDSNTWKPKATLHKQPAGQFLYYKEIALTPDGAVLLAVPMLGAVEVWVVGEPDSKPLGVGFGEALAISPDGKTAAVALSDMGDSGPGLVFVDPKTGKEKAP